jgi:hypothetical protein
MILGKVPADDKGYHCIQLIQTGLSWLIFNRVAETEN